MRHPRAELIKHYVSTAVRITVLEVIDQFLIAQLAIACNHK
jgi:hypothetical protein